MTTQPLQPCASSRKTRSGLPIIPWFSWAFFDHAAAAALREFTAAAKHRRGVPFNPASPHIGSAGRKILWILEDASGQAGGGGAAAYIDPARPAGAHVPWSFDAFHATELEHHSTFLEGFNANRNLRRAAERGYRDVIEIIDNSAWVFNARSGASPDATLQRLLAERACLRSEFPDLRVFSVWQAREHDQLADALSKLVLEYTEDTPRAKYQLGPSLEKLPSRSPSLEKPSTPSTRQLAGAIDDAQPCSGRDWADAHLLCLGFAGLGSRWL